MKAGVFLFTALAALALSVPTFGRIINIPDDFQTIQGGIDDVEEEDTVLVQQIEALDRCCSI